MNTQHTPVLLDDVIALLDPKRGQSFFDGTAGYGGHANAILERLGSPGRVVLVDRDEQAVDVLSERFGDQAEVRRANFLDAAKDLAAEGASFDLVLLDLGVSSPQLDLSQRGFSFRSEGPLDMRMDQSQSLTAADVVNTYGQQRLAELIAQFGEERRAKAVAKAIVQARPLHTTAQLANVVRRVVVGKWSDIDPATRTFQAIRIEVNAELRSLTQALGVLAGMLTEGGRLAVISFHSLEDRIVKTFFTTEAKGCICPPKQPICTCGPHRPTLEILTPKPILGETNDNNNPRARSAKLRAVVKINKNQKEGK